MGDTAENVAEAYGIQREAMDEFAFESQRRAAEAVAAGVFRGGNCPCGHSPAEKGPHRL